MGVGGEEPGVTYSCRVQVKASRNEVSCKLDFESAAGAQAVCTRLSRAARSSLRGRSPRKEFGTLSIKTPILNDKHAQVVLRRDANTPDSPRMVLQTCLSEIPEFTFERS